ncbi:MAG: hypothetical protein IIX40_01950, partial [Alistipes sp.]|nr:hypothetical protein [Alistipes sp.]
MEQQNQNITSATESENIAHRTVSFREVFDKSVSNWFWYIISVVVFLGVGAFYLLSTSPVYHREATVLIKDARRGSAASELSAFADIAGIST